MTKINKILVKGFKSFANRTELLFGEKFNCVLGPNGSGKSNILDSICFVLGKSSSRALRAEKSANLVYNGGKSKKSAKQGEVSIFFDNSKKIFPTDMSQVKITRIIKSNGQSVYKINDKRRTRHEMLELLSLAKIDPNGYNIILQGDIVRFVEMHPVQRREIIEEIAGISLYEEKKQSALRELDKVDGKLNEADIILTERKAYLRELKKERDQALRYKEMADKIKQNKASYLKIQIDQKSGQKSKLQSQVDNLNSKTESKNKKITAIKQKNSELKEEIEKISKEVETKGETEQVRINKEVENLKIDIAKNKSRIESLESELKKIKNRKEDLKINIEKTENSIKDLKLTITENERSILSLNKEKSIIEEKISRFKKKHNMDDAGDIEDEIDKLDKFAEDKQKDIQVLRENQQDLIREQDKISYQIQTIDEKISKVLEVEKENKVQIDNLKQMKSRFKSATLDLNKCLDEDSTHSARLGQSRKTLLIANENLAKLKVRTAGIKEKISRDIAVKKIVENKERFKGVLGTVSDLGNVSSKYALALETAAGPRMRSIVVDNDKAASDCIKYLKSNRLGTATFLPINKLKARDTDPKIKDMLKSNGVEGLAIDLVEFEPRLNKVFKYIFANTLVVDNIDVARRLGIGKAKMVTLDGDMAEISGVMHGGYRKASRSGYGFKEKELTKDIDKTEEMIAELQNTISALEKRREENEAKITKLREEKANLEGDIIKTEKSLHLDSGDMDLSSQKKDELSKQLEQIEAKINHIQNTLSAHNRGLANCKIKKQELRSKSNELRNPLKLAELNTFEQKKAELNEQLIKLRSESENMKMQADNIFTPELESSSKIIRQLVKEEEDFRIETKELDEKISKDSRELKVKEEKVSEFYSQFKSLFSKRSKIQEEISHNEIEVDDLLSKSRETEQKSNVISLQLAGIKAELSGLEKDFEQYHSIKLFTDKPEEQLKSEISKFERMVENIGSVNLKSLEIYESVEEEYSKLLQKKDTLKVEKDDVLEMMKEIEGKKRELFMNTYDVVNANFKEIFMNLSTKGEASLDLETPESPFEGGLNIKVRLSGNKFMDIRGLSGGEKTMTALAFIFAIQEHDPATFYVLDEVDAALDKKNSEKLAKLIRKYSDRSQYVIISHNDGIISEADNLYGVSMDEHGISNVVSLKI